MPSISDAIYFLQITILNRVLMRPLSLWHLPVFLMLAIYLPASIFGLYIFRDVYSVMFLVLLSVFVMIYYWLYPRFCMRLFGRHMESFFWNIGDKVNWTAMALGSVVVYIATIITASLTTDFTPLGAALRGGSDLDIANARANFLANRIGIESLLRYSAVILGRAVMPFLIVYAYWTNNKYRHLVLIGLLLCYFIFLEKALPIFLFFPLILLSLQKKRFFLAATHLLSLLIAIGLLAFLAQGGLHDATKHLNVPKKEYVAEKSNLTGIANKVITDDPLLHFYPLYVVFPEADKSSIKYRSIIILNRALWIPYVTAYDWLKFQDEVLSGKLTYGRSIGIVSWLLGESKLQIERMVYKYEGLGGDGASNTVFFVDAKIAFGWVGVFLYCVLFTLIANLILSSRNEPAKIASVTGFFTICLSPLTASLLSGGLFFYILICLLIRPTQLEDLV